MGWVVCFDSADEVTRQQYDQMSRMNNALGQGAEGMSAIAVLQP